jgi:hypothetical protein
LDALRDASEMRWCDMPDKIGFKTLYRMVEKKLIEQVPNGQGPYSKKARWRLRSEPLE